MQLIPWTYHTRYGFTLRGWHTARQGKPVLHFLHGNGFCARSYQPMLAILAQDYDLFLSDAQGHGDSDHGGPFLGWNVAAELAAQAFIQHREYFGHVPVYGVGHSFGGVLTALMHAHHPGLFQGLVLLDPVLFPPSMILLARTLEGVRLFKKNPLAKAALRRRQHWPDQQGAYEYLRSKALFKSWHPDALAAYTEHALHHQADGSRLKCLPQREADIFSSYPRGLWPALQKAPAPISVIIGEDTFPFVMKAVTKWQQVNPKVQKQVVKGGHCFMQEAPFETAQLVKTYLQRFTQAGMA